MKETRKRSIAKAVCYRIICVIVLAIITYLITGNITQMTAIVLIFQSIQMFIYYFHERVWEQIKWGYC